MLNQQALLAAERGDPEEGEQLLQKARQLYLDFRARHPLASNSSIARESGNGAHELTVAPHSPYRLIDVMETAAGADVDADSERRRQRWIQFESNATLTLYYMAQVV